MHQKVSNPFTSAVALLTDLDFIQRGMARRYISGTTPRIQSMSVENLVSKRITLTYMMHRQKIGGVTPNATICSIFYHVIPFNVSVALGFKRQLDRPISMLRYELP